MEFLDPDGRRKGKPRVIRGNSRRTNRDIKLENVGAPPEVLVFTATLFVPGPEDVAIGAFLASKVGNAIIKGGGRLFGKFFGKADDVTSIVKGKDTLEPGPFAKESIPGHRGRPTPDEQRQVNELMEQHGCHTCGTKDPGTKSGDAVADHQPPQALDEPKEFLPHCIDCARKQGGQVRQELRRQKNEGN